MECVFSSLPSKLLLQNLRLKSVSTFSCLDSNSGKENSSRKNPRDLQAAKFFQVDPAAVFVCFLQASSEECVCKLALA
ncbi:hypothetical protein IGI04_014082 [Brassica rapa subsp. trilocularis]|uniref:Uncharacterized protein n=1 Tax=Brassica rapa subsp. trilocularis TaxID=1813537 RepID=A0ABQ7MNK9_BRACM|nr:hypothetical protein IGI04_014082 [Brassica rapa subsp. trilocularis]